MKDKEDFAHRLFTLRDLFKNTVINMALRDDLELAEKMALDTIAALKRDLKHSLIVAKTCRLLNQHGWRYLRSDHTNAFDLYAWRPDMAGVTFFLEAKSYPPPWTAENTKLELKLAEDWGVTERLLLIYPRGGRGELVYVKAADLYEHCGKIHVKQGVEHRLTAFLAHPPIPPTIKVR